MGRTPFSPTLYTRPWSRWKCIPRFALNYNFGKQSVYAVAAGGIRQVGSIQPSSVRKTLPSIRNSAGTMRSGLKSPLFKNILYADVALFYIDWKNQQIYQTVPSGRGSMLKNAGQSVSKGAEISLRASLNRGYEFNLAYGYTHATFISHEVNPELNYNGNFLPYVPRHTLALNAAKSFVIRSSRLVDNIKVSLLYRGNGEIFWDEENSHEQAYYGLADGSSHLLKAHFSSMSGAGTS